MARRPSARLAGPIAPTLAILDWSMPKVDGLQVCRALRETVPGQYVYIILLTSHDRDDDVLEGFDAGADDYITKPFDTRQLKVACALRRAHRPAAAAAHRRSRAAPREGDARSADWIADERCVLRNLRRRDRTRPSHGPVACADDDGPRSLQERQRPLRSPGRRRRAAGNGAPPEGDVSPRRRHWEIRWRRVRGAGCRAASERTRWDWRSGFVKASVSSRL